MTHRSGLRPAAWYRGRGGERSARVVLLSRAKPPGVRPWQFLFDQCGGEEFFAIVHDERLTITEEQGGVNPRLVRAFMALLEKRRFSGVAEQERRAAAVGGLPQLCDDPLSRAQSDRPVPVPRQVRPDKPGPLEELGPCPVRCPPLSLHARVSRGVGGGL